MAGATFSVDRTRVLKGRVVVAWLRPARGGFRVVAADGSRRRIGVATSPAEAMLMTVRDVESPRTGSAP